MRFVDMEAEIAKFRGGFYPPDLEDWGTWRVDPTNYTLVAGTWRTYYVDLERCLTSAEVLDWIMQVDGKRFATRDVLAGLVRALDWLLEPQATLCSFGGDKSLSREQLRERVDRAVAAFPGVVVAE